jgi:adenosylmethionine-8-amino-7-oxononanoate aminotransferase
MPQSKARSETDRLQELAQRHLWMPYSPAVCEPVPVLTRAEGVRVKDSEGNWYLDGIGSLEACAIGHGVSEMARTMARQAETLEFLDVFRYTSEPAVELATELARLTPGSLSRVQFCAGGSEAVETAMKIARQYQRLRGEGGRFKVVSRRGAYHGCTYGAMAIDGNYWSTQTALYEPLPPFGRFVEDPRSGEQLEAMIVNEGAETVAAVIVDPAGTAMGVQFPPDHYLPEVRAICDRHGVLLIVDEVLTGFGHTGRMFCVEHFGIVPDIMTLSKALSSGYLPIGATVVREEVASLFSGSPEGILYHGQTFGGHPIACAVALENLRILERDQLVARAASVGEYFGAQLETKVSRLPFCAEVRGKALLRGIEIQRAPGKPFPDRGEIGRQLRLKARDLGLITLTLHPGDTLFLAPPLIISESELDEMVAILARTIEEVGQANQ